MKKENVDKAYEAQEKERQLSHWLEKLEKEGALTVKFVDKDSRINGAYFPGFNDQIPLSARAQAGIKEQLKAEIAEDLEATRQYLQMLLDEK